jgi:hypothetical protein
VGLSTEDLWEVRETFDEVMKRMAAAEREQFEDVDTHGRERMDLFREKRGTLVKHSDEKR